MADYLVVQGLRESFGREVAVAGVSFGVERGKILTLLGPERLRQDDDPALHRRSRAARRRPHRHRREPMTSTAEGITVPPERRNVGLVFQSYAVWPHMTVAQNVATLSK